MNEQKRIFELFPTLSSYLEELDKLEQRADEFVIPVLFTTYKVYVKIDGQKELVHSSDSVVACAKALASVYGRYPHKKKCDRERALSSATSDCITLIECLASGSAIGDVEDAVEADIPIADVVVDKCEKVKYGYVTFPDRYSENGQVRWLTTIPSLFASMRKDAEKEYASHRAGLDRYDHKNERNLGYFKHPQGLLAGPYVGDAKYYWIETVSGQKLRW